MTIYSNERWTTLVNDTFAEITKLAKLKGAEYSGDVDRLANFRRGGALLDLPQEVILHVYAAKHWDAITQYVKDLNTGKTRDRLESISGRVDDIIVYMLLLKAMIEEKNADDADNPANASKAALPSDYYFCHEDQAFYRSNKATGLYLKAGIDFVNLWYARRDEFPIYRKREG